MGIRTDLAVESKQLWEQSAEQTTQLRGVRAVSRGDVTEVEILNEDGAKALGKPVGRYRTLEIPKISADVRSCAERLAEELEDFLRLKTDERVLLVGLGNRAVTPDALGPKTVDRLFLTRHLIENLPEQFASCRSVSALCPGVLATTGIESLETVKGVAACVRPDRIICIDALAAGSVERLCRTVQLTDNGIAPGSGVGNCRAAFCKKSLGVPVFSVGVPTVVDADSAEPMIVTPRDIDAQIGFFASFLSAALNLVLHSEFDYDDFAQFTLFR